MKSSHGIGPLLETLAVIAAVGVISTSVTFAALQSPSATLANNTINVGAADLRIGTNGTTFTVPSIAGFTFDGVVPGGGETPTAGNTFYLKNYGSAPLTIKASVSTTPTNLANVNLAKVYLDFTRIDDGSTELSVPLKTLMDANSTGGYALNEIIQAGATAQFSLRVSMDVDAYSGTGVGVSISGISLAFTGSGS